MAKYWILVLFTILLKPNISNGQAEKYAPYVLEKDAKSRLLKPEILERNWDKLIIAEKDTLPIMWVRKINGRIYHIDCFVDGKFGYIEYNSYYSSTLTKKDLNRIIRNQWNNYFEVKEKRKMLAKEYDDIKRKRKESGVIPYYTFKGEGELSICDIRGTEIGTRYFTETDVIFFYSYMDLSNNQFYKAIFHDEKIIIPSNSIRSYIKNFNSDYITYLKHRQYLGEDSRYFLAKLQVKEFEESVKVQKKMDKDTELLEAKIVEQEKTKPIIISKDINADRSIQFIGASRGTSLERKGAVIPYVSEINYGVLEDTKEWYLSDTQQWKTYNNNIIYNLRLLEYGDVKYIILALISEKLSNFYVFNINQLSKFEKLKDKEINRIEIPVKLYLSSKIDYSANNRRYNNLEEDIIKLLSKEYNSFCNLHIEILPFMDDDIVRFNIIEEKQNSDSGDGSTTENKIDMSMKYIETTLSKFNKLTRVGFEH